MFWPVAFIVEVDECPYFEAISDIRGAVKMEEGNAIYNFECAKILMDYGDGSLETSREAKEYLERAVDEIEDKSEYYLYARVLAGLESEEEQLPVSSFIMAISITDQDSHLRGTSNTELEEYLKSHREIGGEIIYELDEAIIYIIIRTTPKRLKIISLQWRAAQTNLHIAIIHADRPTIDWMNMRMSYFCRGDQYQSGEVVEQNMEKAFGYFRDAIDQYQLALNYTGTDNESCRQELGR